MAITASMLRPGLGRWASEQSRSLEGLRRAMAIVGRDHPDPRSLDTIVSGLLLAVARAHEGQLGTSFERLETAMLRLMDDLDDLDAQRMDGAVRAPELRDADLRTVAQALDAMPTFEQRLRQEVDANALQLRDTLRELANRTTAPVPMPAPSAATAGAVLTHPPLARTLSRGDALVELARDVHDAFRRRRTLEPPNVADVAIPAHTGPALLARMGAMARAAEAVDVLRSATPPPTSARAVEAVEELQRATAEASEALRGAGERFDATVTGDRQPPLSGAARPGLTPEAAARRAAAHADALAAQGRIENLVPQGSMAQQAAAAGQVPADVLMAAMSFSDLRARASGTLSEPIARAGLENATLGSAKIRALRTVPPWLAGRLADLVDGWERAHLVGPGFGGELFAGLWLAPEGVNQIAQNRGVERILRDLGEASRAGSGVEITPTITATGRRLAIPLAGGGFEWVDVLGSVEYVLASGDTPHAKVTITVQPSGSWAVTHDLPAGAWPDTAALNGTR